MQSINYSNYKNLTKKNILIYFWASWCPECLNVLKTLKEINSSYLFDINLEEFKKAYDIYNISFCPTFLIMSNGQEVLKKEGFITKTEIKNLLKKISCDSIMKSVKTNTKIIKKV